MTKYQVDLEAFDAVADPDLVEDINDLIRMGITEVRNMIRDGSPDVKIQAIKLLTPLMSKRLDPKVDSENEEFETMKTAMAEIQAAMRK